jgi:hypothetical protein
LRQQFFSVGSVVFGSVHYDDPREREITFTSVEKKTLPRDMLPLLSALVVSLAVAEAALPDKFSEPTSAIFSRTVQRVFQSSLLKAFQQHVTGVLLVCYSIISVTLFVNYSQE